MIAIKFLNSCNYVYSYDIFLLKMICQTKCQNVCAHSESLCVDLRISVREGYVRLSISTLSEPLKPVDVRQTFLQVCVVVSVNTSRA